ncbi:uncharacterized protein V1478_006619 [Vespula squamosa]|uniref:RPGRIP1 C-terminal domain-containing protein n=1 Tax=Vespula squamosa TaxID=30214 RepID=A0ABD2B8G3_VESSQ
MSSKSTNSKGSAACFHEWNRIINRFERLLFERIFVHWKNRIKNIKISLTSLHVGYTNSSITMYQLINTIDIHTDVRANVISDINENKKRKEENQKTNEKANYSSTHDNNVQNGSSDSDITSLSKQSDEITRWTTLTNKEEQDNLSPEEKAHVEEFNSFISHPIQKDTIIIQIVKINLFENSSVMLDDNVHLLYVEYSFLGFRGADMETESIVKPKSFEEALIYNFKKIFPIDKEYHSIERNTLRAMLHQSTNPNIKFILVSEPLPEETDTKDCVELGYAYFNIREYALGDDEQSIRLPITNQMQTEQIGLLTIYVQGLDAIRKCLSNDM